MNIIPAALLILIPSASASQNACDYAILSKGFVYSDITNPGPAQIDGNVGSSSTSSVFQGFGVLDPPLSTDAEFSISTIVNGRMYSVDHKFPTPPNLDDAVHDMELAYNEAYFSMADHYDIHAGNIPTEKVLTPGIYWWDSDVTVPVNGGGNGVITFDGEGNTDAVWIIQISGDLTISGGAKVLLDKGAKAKTSSGRYKVILMYSPLPTPRVSWYLKDMFLCFQEVA